MRQVQQNAVFVFVLPVNLFQFLLADPGALQFLDDV
jgi:hypothetical protein